MSARKTSSKKLNIKQVRSQIGCMGSQRLVLKGLGLGRIGREVTKIDDPCIRGMVTKVSHLVTVEEVEG
jgi:large subunit ribosomal protein L30